MKACGHNRIRMGYNIPIKKNKQMPIILKSLATDIYESREILFCLPSQKIEITKELLYPFVID